MIRLELKQNEPVEKALKKFKKLCDREGLTRDMRKSSTYEKPSERNKRQKREQEKERAKQVRLNLKRKSKARKSRMRAIKKATSQFNAARAKDAAANAESESSE